MLSSTFCECLQEGHSHSKCNEYDLHNQQLCELAQWDHTDESHSVHFDNTEGFELKLPAVLSPHAKVSTSNSPLSNITPQATNVSTAGAWNSMDVRVAAQST